MMTENQIITPQQVCPTCLMADQSGQPRWHEGQLRCGRALDRLSDRQPEQFECQMGFRVVHIE
jgi:hypothetical protein